MKLLAVTVSASVMNLSKQVNNGARYGEFKIVARGKHSNSVRGLVIMILSTGELTISCNENTCIPFVRGSSCGGKCCAR
jgi:hypothetical protein